MEINWNDAPEWADRAIKVSSSQNEWWFSNGYVFISTDNDLRMHSTNDRRTGFIQSSDFIICEGRPSSAKGVLATDFKCFSELADLIGEHGASFELCRVIDSGVDYAIGCNLSGAFTHGSTPQGFSFWRECLNGGYGHDGNSWRYLDKFFPDVGCPTDAWQEGEERMNNIAQNGNDGHYERKTVEHDKKNKYSRKIKTISLGNVDHAIYVDVYDVLTAFEVVNPAMAHAVKKMLAPGQRGAKDTIQDMKEAIQSIERAIELEMVK